MTLNTAFLLMAQYNGKAIVSLADVCRDHFSHLTPEKLMRKVVSGQIPLPIVHIERSQKSARGVHLQDLADFKHVGPFPRRERQSRAHPG